MASRLTCLHLLSCRCQSSPCVTQWNLIGKENLKKFQRVGLRSTHFLVGKFADSLINAAYKFFPDRFAAIIPPILAALEADTLGTGNGELHNVLDPLDWVVWKLLPKSHHNEIVKLRPPSLAISALGLPVAFAKPTCERFFRFGLIVTLIKSNETVEVFPASLLKPVTKHL